MSLPAAELVVLAGLRGGKAVVGVHDPLRGLAEPDVDRALIAARDGLAQRGYLRLDADGVIELDADVAKLVDVVVHAERSYFAYLVTGAALDAVTHGHRRVFHTRAGDAVEVGEAKDLARVTRLADFAAIEAELLSDWRIDRQPAASGEPAVLPQRVLHEAAAVAARDGRAACFEHLADAGVRTAAAAALASTLAAPRRNAALIAFTLDQPGHTQGMGMLEGDNGLWRLRPRDAEPEPLVELEPVSAASFKRSLRDFLGLPVA